MVDTFFLNVELIFNKNNIQKLLFLDLLYKTIILFFDIIFLDFPWLTTKVSDFFW